MRDELLTVATASTPEESALIRNLLEASGIPAWLIDEASVGTAWHLAGAIGGVKVQVAASDAERARAVLEQRGEKGEELPAIRKGRYRRSGSATTPRRRAAKEDEEEASPREEDARRAQRLAVIGLFFPPLWLIATLLLLRVWLSAGRLDDRGRRRSWVAAGIICAVSLALGLFIAGGLFLGGGRATLDNLDLRGLRHPERMVGVWQRWLPGPADQGLQVLELRADGRFTYRWAGAEPAEGVGSWGYEDNWFIFRIDRLTQGKWEQWERTMWWQLEALTEDQMTVATAEGSTVFSRKAVP